MTNLPIEPSELSAIYIADVQLHYTEAVAQRFSMKKVFLEISQNSQENFIKKETLARVFSCEFCEISKNTFSYRTPPVPASHYKTSSVINHTFNCSWLPDTPYKVFWVINHTFKYCGGSATP